MSKTVNPSLTADPTRSREQFLLGADLGATKNFSAARLAGLYAVDSGAGRLLCIWSIDQTKTALAQLQLADGSEILAVPSLGHTCQAKLTSEPPYDDEPNPSANGWVSRARARDLNLEQALADAVASVRISHAELVGKLIDGLPWDSTLTDLTPTQMKLLRVAVTYHNIDCEAARDGITGRVGHNRKGASRLGMTVKQFSNLVARARDAELLERPNSKAGGGRLTPVAIRQLGAINPGPMSGLTDSQVWEALSPERQRPLSAKAAAEIRARLKKERNAINRQKTAEILGIEPTKES